MFKLVIFIMIIAPISTSWASNENRELEYAEEIETSLSGGKIVWLKAKDKRFLTLYTETEQKEYVGTAIILHSMGGHPDQQKLINPLRTYLPKHHWATLSLQLPVLGNDAKENEYYPLFDDANRRIQAGVDYLVSAGVQNIVLIGYGLGGMMAVSFLNDKTDVADKIKAIVTISLRVPNTKHEKVQITDFIAKIEQPFLDIFAEHDLPEVTDSASKRRLSANTSSAYRQFQIDGYLLEHDEALLVKRVYSWIRKMLI